MRLEQVDRGPGRQGLGNLGRDLEAEDQRSLDPDLEVEDLRSLGPDLEVEDLGSQGPDLEVKGLGNQGPDLNLLMLMLRERVVLAHGLDLGSRAPGPGLDLGNRHPDQGLVVCPEVDHAPEVALSQEVVPGLEVTPNLDPGLGRVQDLQDHDPGPAPALLKVDPDHVPDLVLDQVRSLRLIKIVNVVRYVWHLKRVMVRQKKRQSPNKCQRSQWSPPMMMNHRKVVT